MHTARPNTAVYTVVPRGHTWAINHDGKIEGSYATKEGAFEAIIGAASNSIKDGFGVSIHIPASDADRPNRSGRLAACSPSLAFRNPMASRRRIINKLHTELTPIGDVALFHFQL